MRFSLYTLGALALFLFSCKTAQYPADELPPEQLRFGKGGGFTGAVTTYILLANGQLFRHESLTDTLEPLAPLKRKEAKTYWQRMEALALTNYSFDEPGNLTYFLEVRTDSLTHRLQWNDQRPLDRTDVLEFHRQLMAITQP